MSIVLASSVSQRSNTCHFMAKCVYLRDSSSIKYDAMNCHFAYMVLAQLYYSTRIIII